MIVLCPLLSSIEQSAQVARTRLDSHDPQLVKQLRFDLTAEHDTPGLDSDFRRGAEQLGIECARRTEKCPVGFNPNRRRYTPGFVLVEGSRTLKLRSIAALDFACEWVRNRIKIIRTCLNVETREPGMLTYVPRKAKSWRVSSHYHIIITTTPINTYIEVFPPILVVSVAGERDLDVVPREDAEVERVPGEREWVLGPDRGPARLPCPASN